MPTNSSNRILMLSTHGYVAAHPELGRPDTGGQVVYVLELASCLARMGCQVDLATRQFGDQPASEKMRHGSRLLRFPCGGREFIPKETLCDHIPQWVDNALKFIADNGLEYDFISSHYWDAGMAGQALAQALGIAHLHTPHSIGSWKRDSMPGDDQEKEKQYNFLRRIEEEQRIYRDCDALIATTPQQFQLLCEGAYNVPAQKIHVVPPGYDDDRFFPVDEPQRQEIKQRLNMQGKVVLALGRLARNKGYDLLIQAMRPVFERVPDAKLVLAIGSTHVTADATGQQAALRQISQDIGYADRVVFGDYIPDEELADYYRAADVFALSSRYEPFGMTAIEAMACGTPTVVTTEGGLWEQIQWGVEALYADPNDPESFGHMLSRPLLFAEVSAQLAEHGAAKAREKFTWKAVSQQIIDLSEELRHRRDHTPEAATSVSTGDQEELVTR